MGRGVSAFIGRIFGSSNSSSSRGRRLSRRRRRRLRRRRRRKVRFSLSFFLPSSSSPNEY